jgi:hypothetical protein
MLIVWHWKKVMMMIHVGNLAHHIQSLQLTLPGKKLTLVVYGAEEYFRLGIKPHIQSLKHAADTVTHIMYTTLYITIYPEIKI